MKALSRVLLSALFISALVGCENATEKRVYSSNSTGASCLAGVNLSTEPILLCNQVSGSMGIDAKVKTYFDNFGTYNENLVRLRFVTTPTGFMDNSDIVIRFYRWQATLDGSSTYMDPTPLEFTVERANFPGQNVSGLASGFDVDHLGDISSDTGGPMDITEYVFVIRGTTASYQVLQVAVRENDGGGEVSLGQADMLIPAIHANPNAYTCNHPDILTNLHPLIGKASENWTSSQYESFGDGFCF